MRPLPPQNGFAIRAIRERSGLKCGELALRVRATESTLRNVELEHKQASPELLARIAQALDVPVQAVSNRSGS